jgi:tRNA pseudouridine55 synthase
MAPTQVRSQSNSEKTTELSRCNGALLVDKHEGPTSFGIIGELQRTLCEIWDIKRKSLPKIGHGGTLDPFATGLLVVLIGNATKLSSLFLGSKKSYLATAMLGKKTDSGDLTGQVLESTDQIPKTDAEIQLAVQAFCSRPYLQRPPMHSAIKQNGRPLYELARQGIEVERMPRLCQIHELTLLNYEAPLLQFHAQVSAGTYIRTLAEDLATEFQCLAHLRSLRRTASGHFRVDQAQPLSEVNKALRNGVKLPNLPNFINFNHLLDGYPSILISEEQSFRIQNGDQACLKLALSTLPQRPQSGKEVDPPEDREPSILTTQWATLRTEDGAIIALLSKAPTETEYTLDRIFRQDD